MTSLRGAAAIVGISDMVSPSGVIGRPARQVEFEVARAALDDAGISSSEVDGLFAVGSSPLHALQLAEYLGIQPRTIGGAMTGGSSFEIHVATAAAAIAAGECNTALIVYAEMARSGPPLYANGFGEDPSRPDAAVEFEVPYGLPIPVGAYALAASRHMAIYGTTSEQLAQIAVSTRQWAALNSNARYRKPLSIDEVLASGVIASPLHRLDCCLRVDGAGAVVITSPERAKYLKQKPVHVLGCGTSATHMNISQMPDLTETGGKVSGKQAFEMAGVGPHQVDVVLAYDSFTITVLLALEDLGFCQKGEGGRFVQDGKLGPGGSLPTNTNGGGLSYCHPGMYGIFLLVEAARQLRGTLGDRQVPNAEIALAHGVGGMLSCASTVILGGENTI